jgi:hypothetical protein
MRMRKPIQITLRPEAPSTPLEVFRCGLILPTAFRSPIPRAPAGSLAHVPGTGLSDVPEVSPAPCIKFLARIIKTRPPKLISLDGCFGPTSQAISQWRVVGSAMEGIGSENP